MSNVSEQSDVTPRAGRPFVFTRTRGNATAEFFPGAGTRLRFASNDTDTLVLSGLPFGTIEPGDLVTAAYLGTTVFVGTVATITERQGRGTDRVEDVTVEGPWGLMARIVYRQTWAVGSTGMTQSSSRLVLNRTPAGLGMDMTAQVLDIAGYAASLCGFSAAAANIDAGTQVLPPDEARDITCADAIRRTLRFFPQTVCRFDYSQSTPALHVSIPPATPVQASYISSIPKTQRTITRTAHPVGRVDIATEAIDTTSADGTPLRAFSHQVYPPYPTSGTDPISPINTLHAFLPLEKGSASTSWESLDVEVLDENHSVFTSLNFWVENHPSLAGFTILPPGQSYDGSGNKVAMIGTMSPTAAPSGCPNMTDTTVGDLERFGLQAQVVRLTRPVKIYTPEKEEEQVLTLDYVFTNATSRTYTRQTGSSSTAGETLPSGLAEAIYRQRSGTITAEEMTIRLGASLPTLGDALVETVGTNESETLYLQNFEIDCYDLTARLHFGKPEYLSPEEMRDLLLGFRQRAFASNAPNRNDPDEAQDSEDVGGVQPLKSSSFVVSSVKRATVAGTSGNSITLQARGAAVPSGQQAGTQLVVTDSSSKSIKLDAHTLAANEAMSVHTLNYTDSSGNSQTVKVLATDDATIPEGGSSGDTTSLTGDTSSSDTVSGALTIGGAVVDQSSGIKNVSVTTTETQGGGGTVEIGVYWL